jgi:uncharacterized membrane protein
MTIKFVHLLTLVVWFGGMIFFSFIAAPSIFKILPKEDAGDVVGEIFPKYYLIGYVASLTLLGTLFKLGQGNFRVIPPMIILAIMSGLTFYSGLIVGPKVRKMKAKMREISDEAQKEELEVSFKRTHSFSMILNVSVIGLSIVYLAFVPLIFLL